MREAISVPLKRHAGIIVNPHLFRHAIAKIVVERNPEMYVAVSRRLGHRSINTTLGSYLGTETRAASRQINRLLHEARDRPELED
jgi:integrase